MSSSVKTENPLNIVCPENANNSLELQSKHFIKSLVGITFRFLLALSLRNTKKKKLNIEESTQLQLIYKCKQNRKERLGIHSVHIFTTYQIQLWALRNINIRLCCNNLQLRRAIIIIKPTKCFKRNKWVVWRHKDKHLILRIRDFPGVVLPEISGIGENLDKWEWTR